MPEQGCYYKNIKGGHVAYIHEGVYGDHSTDGWLEWGVDARFAMQRVGEDVLQITPERAAENPVLSRHRTEAIDNLGYLAAQELRAQGIEIKEFEPEVEAA